MERTLILLKPDCIERRLIGEILGRFERKGLTFVGMKMVHVSPDLSRKHYQEHVAKPFYQSLEQFITSGPVIAIAAEGPSAVTVVRDMLGPTSGVQAPPGTIRGDFGLSRQLNLVHGSDSTASAAREIALWFRDDELCSHEFDLLPWIVADEERTAR